MVFNDEQVGQRAREQRKRQAHHSRVVRGYDWRIGRRRIVVRGCAWATLAALAGVSAAGHANLFGEIRGAHPRRVESGALQSRSTWPTHTKRAHEGDQEIRGDVHGSCAHFRQSRASRAKTPEAFRLPSARFLDAYFQAFRIETPRSTASRSASERLHPERG